MKYLKLYESFDSSYFEITGQEFNLPLEYNDNPYGMIRKLRSILPDVEYTSLSSESNSISFQSSIGIFIIKFGSDEWFKVRFNPKNEPKISYWKCDQLDGLINLLKYLKLL